MAPILLLFHGGGFVGGSAEMPEAASAARAAGMRPVSIDYPLGNLRAAIRSSRQAARSHRRAYAYGESVGGTLAVLLAQRGLVQRAVGFMPAVDLRTAFATSLRAFRGDLDTSNRELRRASPIHHRSRHPVYAQIARDDVLLDVAQQRRWAKRDPRVRARLFDGDHLWASYAPTNRVPQLDSAMRWLSR